MSFPRILPDSSNLPGASKKFFSMFDVRMNYHKSYVLLQDLSNSFHRWFNLSIIHFGVSQQFMLVFLVVISRILKTEEEFSSQSWSVLLKIHSSSLMPSSHNCFRLWELFSTIWCISGVASFLDNPYAIISEYYSFSTFNFCSPNLTSNKLMISSFTCI